MRARVAVLDDDEDAAASLAALLRAHRFDAFAYHDSRSVLAACGDKRFEAFILDWTLVDETAATLIETLRSTTTFAHVPIFLLSGNLAVNDVPEDEKMARSVTLHRLVYRAKPFSPRRLVEELNGLLQRT